MSRLYEIVDALADRGEAYNAAWTATQTNANLARLTDSLTLPKGVYLIIAKVPFCNGNFFGLSVVSNGETIDPITITAINPQGSASALISLDTQTTIYLATAFSALCSYSYLERGGLTAIRMA